MLRTALSMRLIREESNVDIYHTLSHVIFFIYHTLPSIIFYKNNVPSLEHTYDCTCMHAHAGLRFCLVCFQIHLRGVVFKLHQLRQLVEDRGGFHQVVDDKKWAEVVHSKKAMHCSCFRITFLQCTYLLLDACKLCKLSIGFCGMQARELGLRMHSDISHCLKNLWSEYFGKDLVEQGGHSEGVGRKGKGGKDEEKAGGEDIDTRPLRSLAWNAAMRDALAAVYPQQDSFLTNRSFPQMAEAIEFRDPEMPKELGFSTQQKCCNVKSISRRKAAKLSDFNVGDNVSAMMHGSWHPATIQALRSDGKFVIQLNDGQAKDIALSELHLKRPHLSCSTESSPPKPAADAQDPCTLQHACRKSSPQKDWRRMYQFFLSHSLLSLYYNNVEDSAGNPGNARFYGCTVERFMQREQSSSTELGSLEEAHVWQQLTKIRSGDCTAVAGLDHFSGFKTGIHYWEIVSRLLPQDSEEEPQLSENTSDTPSFAVGVVTGDRRPGKVFLGSEPANGVLGKGWGYLGSRGQLMSTGCEPRAYGTTFVAGDTIGVLLDADAQSISFFVNGLDQGVAFTANDFKSKVARMQASTTDRILRPAVALSKPGVQVSIRHRSATQLLAARALRIEYLMPGRQDPVDPNFSV